MVAVGNRLSIVIEFYRSRRRQLLSNRRPIQLARDAAVDGFCCRGVLQSVVQYERERSRHSMQGNGKGIKGAEYERKGDGKPSVYATVVVAAGTPVV